MEYESNIPIYLQVIEDIKSKLVTGELKTGDKLPSNNELAVLYKINPNTVQRIYKELESQGICYTKRGLGTYIIDDDELIRSVKTDIVCTLIINFLKKMQSLGFSPDDTINIINDIKEN